MPQMHNSPQHLEFLNAESSNGQKQALHSIKFAYLCTNVISRHPPTKIQSSRQAKFLPEIPAIKQVLKG